MKHPDKWRDTVNPFSIPMERFVLTEVLGYPHAGNDVFHVRGLFEGRDTTAYIKVERQSGAAIGNEVAVLRQMKAATAPEVLEYGKVSEDRLFSVTEELPGERLSVILGENEKLESLSYMEEYGEALAKIHKLEPKAETVKDRKFFHAPSEEMLEKSELEYLKPLFAKAPENPVTCFCHGDFHYANVLWENGHISAILDFELAGYGNRDFDIAWAIFRRPGQKFLKKREEAEVFLQGYAKVGEYDREAVFYYMAQCYVYFLQFQSNEEEYKEYIRSWLKEWYEECA
ncbi:MAG: aminoglycoside phosphotransferase family protein [Lachnospiraceae bacterium]|jgi:aminoglycoside phosphotransferase (APT) family kinase protein|nr:aminoglycoside phosphotransferase family protein [Lachnospiraceae bacterium]